jgi:hypothetical protein
MDFHYFVGTLSDVGRQPIAHAHRVTIFCSLTLTRLFRGKLTYERKQRQSNVPGTDAADLNSLAFGLAGKPRDIHAPSQKPASENFIMNHQRFSRPFNPFFLFFLMKVAHAR